jgi:hypothetical protein
LAQALATTFRTLRHAFDSIYTEEAEPPDTFWARDWGDFPWRSDLKVFGISYIGLGFCLDMFGDVWIVCTRSKTWIMHDF